MNGYPAGAEYDSMAPYNQHNLPDEEFEVTISQSLSKTVTCETNDYSLDGSDVDTYDTDWKGVYEQDHYTPLQLINLFKRYLESELNHTETVSKHPSYLKTLIKECSDWAEDETEIFEE